MERIRIFKNKLGKTPTYSEGERIEESYDYAFLTNQTFPMAASRDEVLTHCETHVCGFKLPSGMKYHNLKINFVPLFPELYMKKY